MPINVQELEPVEAGRIDPSQLEPVTQPRSEAGQAVIDPGLLEPVSQPARPRFIGDPVAWSVGHPPDMGDPAATFAPFVPIRNPFAVPEGPGADTLQRALAQSGLEPLRSSLEKLAEPLIKAAESVESPGGAALAAAAPAVPELVSGLGAVISAPAAVEGGKQAVTGLREGDPVKVAAGFIQAGLGALPALGAALHMTSTLSRLAPKTAAEAAQLERTPNAPQARQEQEGVQLQRPRTDEVRPPAKASGGDSLQGETQSGAPAPGGGAGLAPAAGQPVATTTAEPSTEATPAPAAGTGTEGTVQPSELTPAIEVQGKLFTGKDHVAAYANAKASGQPDTSGAQEGFVDAGGRFLTREQAAQASGLPTATEPGKLHSSDLPATRAEAKPPTLASGSAPPEPAAPAEAAVSSPSAGVAAPELPGITQATPEPAKVQPAVESAKEVTPDETQTQKGNEEERLLSQTGQRGQLAAQPQANLPQQPAAEGGESTAAQLREQTPPALVEAGGASVGPGAASADEIPPSTGGEDVHGVAQRVREKMAAAGQETLPPRGKGIAPADSVERGRQLIEGGSDPEAIMANFEKTKQLSSDDMAVVRAQGEKLAFAARRAEETFGTDSPEFKQAQDARNAWAVRSKVMQTEWHKTGQAQQGEVDIDTGSFSGMQAAFFEKTGRDFTPSQKTEAEDKAGRVRKAQTAADQANEVLHNYARDRQRQMDAEAAARKAAQEAVIFAARKLAQTAREDLVRKAQLKTEAEQLARAAQERVQAAVNEASKERALRELKQAKAEVARREKLQKEAQRVAEQAENNAQKAVDKATIDAARKLSREERAAAVRRAQLQKEAQAIIDKAEARIKGIADKATRDRAIAAAKAEAADLEARADLPSYVWNKVREYVDQGEDDFDTIRNKVATDIGMPVEKVTEALGKDKRAKFLADDVWRKQQLARRMKQQAKLWLDQAAVPTYRRAINAIPRAMFALKVGFHGTVALGTHAPAVSFQPRFWASYMRDFGKMYRMVANPRYYEMQIQDLQRRPNYTLANRAGLINDPFQYEEYHVNPVAGALDKISPAVAERFNQLTSMGNRGYSVLKILRQDMFDQHWSNLPRTARTPEMAETIADGVNHVTGVVQAMAPKGANIGLFAPRLMASRAMWLAGDPVRAANTFLDWKNASEGDRYFAVNQIKEKAWVMGTMAGLLAANQGMLDLVGSKQNVNVTNPMESDYLQFKVAGMRFAYGNAMVNMAKLPAKLALAIAYRGKLGKVVLEDERVSKILFDYARSQASPFAGTIIDTATGRDYAGRPLPRKLFGALPGDTDIPKRLRMHGITHPYSLTEWASENFSPIPLEEGLKEVWSKLDMAEPQQKEALKALITISVMGGTGGRLAEDIPPSTRR